MSFFDKFTMYFVPITTNLNLENVFEISQLMIWYKGLPLVVTLNEIIVRIN